MSAVLRLEDTVPAALVRHRLALGLSWVDAVTQGGARGPLSTILERVGPFPLELPFERHRSERFALRYAGLVRKRIDQAVKDGLDTAWRLHVHAPAQAGQPGFDPERDARLYVPRRLRLAEVFAGSEPAATPANIRTPWLWPGAAYPFASTATLVRGRVRRGTPGVSSPLRWARIYATTPDTDTVFDLHNVVGCGHGDDRGEYVLALDARAVSGAALSNPVRLRLWAFAAPAAAPDPADSFFGLPNEDGGVEPVNDVMRGLAPPPGYSVQQSRVVELRLGETLSGPDTVFLFSP